MLHLQNFIMNLTFARDFLNFLKCCLLIAILQIKQNGVIEENPVLRNDTDILAVRVKLEIFQILSIKKDISFIGIVDSIDHVNHRSLAKATVSHNSI